MSYKPLRGSNDFEEVIKNHSQKINSEHFRVFILINNKEFKLGMILPKKNIKLAVHRNYLKRTIRNLSIEAFSESKVSVILISNKRILDFKKDKLRREIKTIFLRLIKKFNEENNYIFD